MKRVLIVALSSVLLSMGLTSTAAAATDAQKLSAILNGLAHLDYVQCNTAGTFNGSWSTNGCGGGYNDAMTGIAMFAFLTQQAKWPAGLAAKYATDVANGAKYLLANASTGMVSTNDGGTKICPGAAASCMAIYWNVSGEPTYATGFVATALGTYGVMQGVANVATTTGPLAGLTWTQVMQGVLNAYAAGQATAQDAPYTGGWRYSIPSNDGADMSTTQWGALAAGYAEAAGAVTPANLKPLLSTWLTNDAVGGSACYLGGSNTVSPFCDIGPTNAENGAWLVSTAYVGGNNTAGPLAFLNNNWTTTPNNTWYGNFGHTYAMWSSYKGLEATIGLADTTHITKLMTACGAPNNLPGSGVCNWWEDYNEFLVNVTARTNDGAPGGGNLYWKGDTDESGWQDPMSTAVFTAIIGAAALPTTITQQNPVVTVPAVGQWGLIALAILLVLFAAMKLRRTQTT